MFDSLGVSPVDEENPALRGRAARVQAEASVIAVIVLGDAEFVVPWNVVFRCRFDVFIDLSGWRENTKCHFRLLH